MSHGGSLTDPCWCTERLYGAGPRGASSPGDADAVVYKIWLDYIVTMLKGLDLVEGGAEQNRGNFREGSRWGKERGRAKLSPRREGSQRENSEES